MQEGQRIRVFYVYCHHSEKERHLPRFLICKTGKVMDVPIISLNGECTPNVVWLLTFTLLVLDAFAKSRTATICFVMSVCPSVPPSAWNNSARRTGISHEEVYTFRRVTRRIILGMRSVSVENRRENENRLFVRVKKNQLDAQLILSIFRQPLHVSGVFSPIIRRYNRMYTTIGNSYSF